MGPGTDIIIFSLSRYDDPISSVGFSYAKAFAQQGRVFFIEHPFTWKDQTTESNRSALQERKPVWSGGSPYLQDPDIPDNIIYLVPPRMVPVNYLPEGMLYNGLCTLNDKKMNCLLERVIKDHGIKDFVFFNVFNPFYLNEFPASIKPACKVYLSLDDISQVEYTARHGARREEKIVGSWELAFATGKALCRKLSVSDRLVHHLPNAADFDLFNKAYKKLFDKPDELQPYHHTSIIGYTGSVEYRMDVELVDKIASQHQDKMLVLIGPVSDQAWAALPRRDNILLLGAKPLEVLPAYVQYMNLMIIPFLCNTLTASIYPLKLNEYLAAGKPVVTTDFSEDLQEFSDVIEIANSHDVFLSMINIALAEDNEAAQAARVERALQNTWTNRVAQFWKAVGEKVVVG
jgi:glycosyltransferase involved in cell wall biosynthesis